MVEPFLQQQEHAIVTAGVMTLLAIMRQNDNTTPSGLTSWLITEGDRLLPARVERLSYEEKQSAFEVGSRAAGENRRRTRPAQRHPGLGRFSSQPPRDDE